MTRPDTRGVTDSTRRSPPIDSLLLGVTGSAAALSLPNFVYSFRAAGVPRIGAVLTHSGERFLQPGALQNICDRVITADEDNVNHVEVARWAAAIVVLPATAHTLGCLAHGLAPSILTSTVLAADVPIVLVPAMNLAMWRKPAVQRNLATLSDDGYRIVAPHQGPVFDMSRRGMTHGLAMAEPAEVLNAVRATLPTSNTRDGVPPEHKARFGSAVRDHR